MNKWILLFSLLCLAASLLLVLRNHHLTKKLLQNLNEMVEAAIQGDLSETTFDESRFSALETRFSQYLSSSERSTRNLAEEKERIKELISDISHQTKTPIANLLLYTELLEEEPLTVEAMTQISNLHQQTEKLRFLIDSLVKVSRLETKVFTFHASLQNVTPALLQVLHQFLPKAQAKGLSLTLERQDVLAVFDLKWTVEALGNLVDNAIKYTDAGSITLRVLAYELFICIQVEDTGMGIPEEEQAQIFSRFYRRASSATQEGVGIGLYLSREIITGQGGYIKLFSKPGKGSCFSVYLPKSGPALKKTED